MLETSKDLLFIIIAFCILWFTVFVCWGMYHFISILRNANRMTASIREKIELVDKILKLIKEKLEKGSNHMALITDSVIKLAGFFMEKKNKSAEKKSKKK